MIVSYALFTTILSASTEQLLKLRENVDHIVLYMQENRAFDHYYGTLDGIRGFNDRAPFPMTNKMPNAFYQPTSDGKYMLPFRVDVKRTNAQCMPAPEMAYKSDIGITNGGRFDSWHTGSSIFVFLCFLF